MPAQNKTFTDSQVPQLPKKKKATNVIRKNLTPVEKIPNEREKKRYRRRLIGAFLACAITAGIIVAGLLPALIIYFTKPSTSDTTSSNTNTGGSSGSNINGSNSSSVTYTAPSSSTSNSGSTVSSGTSISSSTSVYGFTAGGAVLSSTTAYYGYEEVTVSCSVNIINITIIITVQRTVNATYWNSFTTFWSGTMNDTYIETASQITYIWTIASGQIIQSSGSPYRAQAQFSLFGTNQTTSGDTYSVTATTVSGLTHTVFGNF